MDWLTTKEGTYLPIERSAECLVSENGEMLGANKNFAR